MEGSDNVHTINVESGKNTLDNLQNAEDAEEQSTAAKNAKRVPGCFTDIGVFKHLNDFIIHQQKRTKVYYLWLLAINRQKNPGFHNVFTTPATQSRFLMSNHINNISIFHGVLISSVVSNTIPLQHANSKAKIIGFHRQIFSLPLFITSSIISIRFEAALKYEYDSIRFE